VKDVPYDPILETIVVDNISEVVNPRIFFTEINTNSRKPRFPGVNLTKFVTVPIFVYKNAESNNAGIFNALKIV
jgi:hypothetical protein